MAYRTACSKPFHLFTTTPFSYISYVMQDAAGSPNPGGILHSVMITPCHSACPSIPCVCLFHISLSSLIVPTNLRIFL